MPNIKKEDEKQTEEPQNPEQNWKKSPPSDIPLPASFPQPRQNIPLPPEWPYRQEATCTFGRPFRARSPTNGTAFVSYHNTSSTMKFLDVDMPKLICLILGIGYLYIPEAYLMGNIVGYPKYNTILITLSDKTSKMTPRTTPHLLWALICVLSAPFSRAESRLNEETSNLSLKTVEERLDDVLRADEGFPAIPSVTNGGI
eukprot:565516-Amorphochlora_amoeboformis.AAC.1